MSISAGIYKHYKGGIYRVVSIAIHDETREPYAVYYQQPIGLDNGIGQYWVKPVATFEEEVEYRGKTTPRFKRMSA